MCMLPKYIFTFFFVNFNPFVSPETSCSISICVCGLKILVHTDWIFSAFVNINEQQWML